jgi:hypothetical protein
MLECLPVALRVISRRCSASVAFGPERTPDGRQARLDQSRMTPAVVKLKNRNATKNDIFQFDL